MPDLCNMHVDAVYKPKGGRNDYIAHILTLCNMHVDVVYKPKDGGNDYSSLLITISCL